MIANQSAAIAVGPKITVAVRNGFGWRCAACPLDMTGMSNRDATQHFFVEHGTEADAEVARQDFPGFAITGTVGAARW